MRLYKTYIKKCVILYKQKQRFAEYLETVTYDKDSNEIRIVLE